MSARAFAAFLTLSFAALAHQGSARALQWLGYASPSTILILGGALIVLAAFVGRFAPKKRRRIRRATILVMLYVTTFAFAAVLHWVHAEGWSRRVWFLADLFEV